MLAMIVFVYGTVYSALFVAAFEELFSLKVILIS